MPSKSVKYVRVAHTTALRMRSMRWRRSLYLAAVAASIAPYMLYYRYSLQYLA